MDQGENKQISVNFVLFGKTGSGKSAAGNTLLGRQAFLSKKSPRSVTQEVQVEHGIVQGVNITVYDTPGFCDTELSEEEIIEKCRNVLSQCNSGICIFLLVIKVDRFTEEERGAVEKIEKFLGQNRMEKTWILFTRGDELEDENQTIGEFIRDTPELKKLMQKFQNRYHVFNNKIKKHMSQVRCLLKKIINVFLSHSSILQRKKLEEPQSSPAAERRVVLLGKAGAGKSASGNTIVGQKCFKSSSGFAAITKKSKLKTGTSAGRKVSVVDTPGLFDADMNPEELMTETGRCVYLSSPGPHAFLITLPLTNRFTSQEQEIIQQIKMMFGEEVLKYAVLLFTHGDLLRGKQIEEQIERISALRDLVKQCGGYHVFNNKDHSNKQQVTELLEKIDRMVEQNGNSCYTNEMFEEAAKCKREKEKREKLEAEKREKLEEEGSKQRQADSKQEDSKGVKGKQKIEEERNAKPNKEGGGIGSDSDTGFWNFFKQYKKWVIAGAVGVGVLCGVSAVCLIALAAVGVIGAVAGGVVGAVSSVGAGTCFTGAVVAACCDT